MNNLTNEQKEFLKNRDNLYYFLYKKQVSFYSQEYSIKKVMSENPKITDFIIKKHPNFISSLDTSLIRYFKLIKPEYYKYNPDIFFLNKNPSFDDFKEINKAIIFELTYNYFLFFHGYNAKKKDNLNMLYKIINHYLKFNNLSEDEKDKILSINPYLGLTNLFKVEKKHIDSYISNHKIATNIKLEVLKDDIEAYLIDRSYVLMNASDINNILSFFLNNCELFCSLMFSDLFSEKEILNNFDTIFLSSKPENILSLTFENLPLNLRNIIFKNDENVQKVYESLKTNSSNIISIFDMSNRQLIYDKDIYLLNINWLNIHSLVSKNSLSFVYSYLITDTEGLVADLLKSNKRKDPIFLSKIQTVINDLPLNEDSKTLYLNKIKQSKYYKDDANLLVHTIQKEQYEEKLMIIKNLINTNKLELKNSDLILKDFLIKIDLDKDTISTSDLINIISKML